MHSSRGIQIVMFILAAILLAVVSFTNDMSNDDGKYIFLVAIIFIVGACIMEPIIQVVKRLDKAKVVINVNNFDKDGVKK